MNGHRRRILKTGALAAGALAAGLWRARRAEAGPAVVPQASKRIAFRNLHTPESLEVEFFRDGDYVPEALSAIQVLLRDFRNGEQHPIDPPLLDYLHDLARSAGVDPQFHVISGYRSPVTNALLHEHSNGVARNSLHMQGRAIDVRLAGIDCAQLAGLALDMARGGVGYYRSSDFVHLDTGRIRSWRG